MFSNAKSQLESAEILPEHRCHKDGAAIIRELLKKGSISKDAYRRLTNIYIGDELLEKNMFVMHGVYPKEVTFQSTVMKRFCEQESALWS